MNTKSPPAVGLVAIPALLVGVDVADPVAVPVPPLLDVLVGLGELLEDSGAVPFGVITLSSTWMSPLLVLENSFQGTLHPTQRSVDAKSSRLIASFIEHV